MKNDKKVEKVFQIEIVETLSNLVEVSAENEQEALLKAQELYRNEDIVSAEVGQVSFITRFMPLRL